MIARIVSSSLALLLFFGCASREARPDDPPTAGGPGTSDAGTRDEAAQAADRVEGAHAGEGTSPADRKPARRLMIEELKLGTGEEAIPGTLVTVHYTGWLLNGTKFDSSVDRGRPFEFQLGGGQVIQGWEQGIKGMRVGGKRRLTIPAHLAYGDRAVGPLIPPRSTLVFEVELLGVN